MENLLHNRKVVYFTCNKQCLVIVHSETARGTIMSKRFVRMGLGECSYCILRPIILRQWTELKVFFINDVIVYSHCTTGKITACVVQLANATQYNSILNQPHFLCQILMMSNYLNQRSHLHFLIENLRCSIIYTLDCGNPSKMPKLLISRMQQARCFFLGSANSS